MTAIDQWTVQLVVPEDGLTRPRQLFQHDPAGRSGDCYRTCIASLAGLEAHEVPHFVEEAAAVSRDGAGWEQMRLARVWLRNRELDLAAVSLDEMQSAGAPYIATVRSHRGPWNHAVVFVGHGLHCDPSGLDDYTADEIIDEVVEVLCKPYDPDPDSMVRLWAAHQDGALQ